MNSLMLGKVGNLAERFPTFLAFIRFFSSMNSLMLSKM
ncbi:unnamed protein product [Gulo gulo]|uniref:Uncharacterized protein n=1 Tax=Gulo gulo TaxID=48420 RepID=A0A9X9LXA3_GULGU|nr:unnamed protein product [Gulo gulo]